MHRKLLVLAVVVATAIAAVGIGASRAHAAPFPVANAGGPYVGVAGVPIQFNGTGSIAATQIVSYQWYFGDNTTAFGAIVNHTYTFPGSYLVTLVVTDALHQASTGSATATMAAGTIVTTTTPLPLFPTNCVLTTAGVVCNGTLANGLNCGLFGLAFPFCLNGVVVNSTVINSPVPLNFWCNLPQWQAPFNRFCNLYIAR